MNRIVKFALIFLVFSCNSSDEESSSLKCSNALKNKDYEVGIEVCSKKERGDAYMGKAGFSLIRIAEYPNGEEPLPEHIVNPETELGVVDNSSSKILKLLNISYSDLNNTITRKEKIEQSYNNFIEAQKYLGAEMNCASTYCQDAAFKYALSNIFSLELFKIKFYDTNSLGWSDNFSINYSDENYKALENYDGYIFKVDENAVLKSYKTKKIKKLCEDLSYMANSTLNVSEGLKRITLSDDDSNNLIDNSKNLVCKKFYGLFNKCNLDGSEQFTCENECSKIKSSCGNSWNNY